MQLGLTVNPESPNFRAVSLILPILKTNFRADRTRYQRTINIVRYSTRGTGNMRDNHTVSARVWNISRNQLCNGSRTKKGREIRIYTLQADSQTQLRPLPIYTDTLLSIEMSIELRILQRGS